MSLRVELHWHSFWEELSDIALRGTWFETGRGAPNASLLVLCSRLSPLWHWNVSKLLTVRYLFAIFPNPIAECIFPTFGHFTFSLCEPWITGVIAFYFALSVLYQQFSMKSSIQKWRISLHSHENECNWKERREAKSLLLAAGLNLMRYHFYRLFLHTTSVWKIS